MWDQYSQVFALGLRGPEERDAVIQVMMNHPPVALIRLTHVARLRQTEASRAGRSQGMGTVQGHVEMGASLVPILRYAYGLDPKFPQNRIIVPGALAYSRYDYVDTMRQGGREELRRALKAQFGVVARREMRPNLVLTLKNPAAGGLHKHNDNSATGAGGFESSNITMAELANGLGKQLGVEVTDQTGLAGGFDYSLDVRNVPYPPTSDDIKKVLLDQLGLELTPAADNQQVEFLVAEKVR